MENRLWNQCYFSMFFLAVGACFMVAAGYLLIQGLSKFSGDAGSQNIFIIFGILFQVGESICFVAAARHSYHSKLWRAGLFSLGLVLFIFSISVMTLAQKASMQVGVNAASAIDEKRDHLRSQIVSLDRMIKSYQHNAEKQSRSIYKDSRALGQDSINRATELESKKLELSDQLFVLSQTRRETSKDFFQRLETIVGLPAQTTEFYFLVLRSFLIELCGIVFLAYGSFMYPVTPLPRPINEHDKTGPRPGRVGSDSGPMGPTDESAPVLGTAGRLETSFFGPAPSDDGVRDATLKFSGDANLSGVGKKSDNEPARAEKSREEPVGADSGPTSGPTSGRFGNDLWPVEAGPELDGAGFWSRKSPTDVHVQADNVVTFSNTAEKGKTKKQIEMDRLALKCLKAFEIGSLASISRDNIKKYLKVGNTKAKSIMETIDRLTAEAAEEIDN